MENYKLVISGGSLLVSGGIILGIYLYGKYQYYKGRVDKANKMKKTDSLLFRYIFRGTKHPGTS